MAYETKADYRKAWEAAYTTDPPIPLCVDIELASACNAKCTFCLYGDRDWSSGMQAPDWDGKPKKRFMPKEMAFQIINECNELGVPSLKFNFRGESLIHPDYGEIVEYAASLNTHKCSCHMFGQHPGARSRAFHEILSNTNGNIPVSNTDSGINGLMACTKVMVSLDSTIPETYAKVRVGLSLDKAKETISELVRRGHPEVWVRRVVCQDNKHEDFVGAVKKLWPQGVKVSEHFAFDRNHYKNESVHAEDVTKWPRKYCGYPSQRVVIEASGRYVPCCIAWDGEFDAGKFPELSIKDYWAGEWRRNLAEQLRRNEFSNAKCAACTSFMAYDRPERDFVQDREIK